MDLALFEASVLIAVKGNIPHPPEGCKENLCDLCHLDSKGEGMIFAWRVGVMYRLAPHAPECITILQIMP